MRRICALTAVDFVRAIAAVGSPVALPAAVDALPVAATELQRRALMSGSGVRRRRATVLGPLVGAVGAVGVAVAGPQAGHAHAVAAPEGRGAAGGGAAGGLVAAVVAVRLLVAHEGGRHALTVRAAELPVRALLRR